MHARIRTFCGVAAALLVAVTVRPAAAEDNKPATGSVEGKVVYRGKPLPGGTVGFHPARGKPVIARIDAEGNYLAPAVPVGEVKVTVETESAKPKGGGLPKVQQARYIAIPEKYARPATSGLTYTVQKGRQTLNIELK